MPRPRSQRYPSRDRFVLLLVRAKKKRVYVAGKGGRFATVASAVRRNCGLNCFSKPSRRAGLPLFDLFLRRLGLGMSALAPCFRLNLALHICPILEIGCSCAQVRSVRVRPDSLRTLQTSGKIGMRAVFGAIVQTFFSGASPSSHSSVFSQLFRDSLSTALVSNSSLPLRAPHLAFKCRGYILVAGPSNGARRLFRPREVRQAQHVRE